ncbi:MAG: UDP-N-acetylmuramoyl-L-alanine--D-glutamate ligase [Lachnospiraceae bacterium]|jgi:UDP-N-acetylmuramoylalanine--D-glutamate ligase|nr:UDP-N-acetylmuramoylalanine-D-glutamate ligase [Lachnospiraceae bacterium A4]MCI8267977.1 UDP-N-acetylmuramoyl-L-alanine--D-glutamate ligase [Lachnospiraceae bacterium]
MMKELKDRRVIVVGTGKSGIGSAVLLEKNGALPVLYDQNDKTDKEAVKAVLREKLGKETKAEVYTGDFPKALVENAVLTVLSPGVPVDADFVVYMKEHGMHVWGEIELAYHFAKGSVIAITGTNGKTTTTSLVGQIMQAHYDSVYIVGNIGNPYTDAAPLMREDTVSVAEISSFQLETIEEFHPRVSAILNITPDHLNRHHTMENYVAAKEAVTINQTQEDYCILNYENEYTRNFGDRCPAKVVYFSSAQRLENGLYYENEDIYLAVEGVPQRLLNVKTDMNLVGVCNIENVMAAIGISMSAGVPMETIVAAVKRFVAVEHRIEYVATKKGVVYYNDSKATNTDAAIQGIKAMDRPTILIGGGYDKDSTYDDWIRCFDGKVKKLVLIGQTREKIAACAVRCGFPKEDILFEDTFEAALEACVREAAAGDAVLLSPACASWGMFPNYEVRGTQFKEYVMNLKE